MRAHSREGRGEQEKYVYQIKDSVIKLSGSFEKKLPFIYSMTQKRKAPGVMILTYFLNLFDELKKTFKIFKRKKNHQRKEEKPTMAGKASKIALPLIILE